MKTQIEKEIKLEASVSKEVMIIKACIKLSGYCLSEIPALREPKARGQPVQAVQCKNLSRNKIKVLKKVCPETDSIICGFCLAFQKNKNKTHYLYTIFQKLQDKETYPNLPAGLPLPKQEHRRDTLQSNLSQLQAEISNSRLTVQVKHCLFKNPNSKIFPDPKIFSAKFGRFHSWPYMTGHSQNTCIHADTFSSRAPQHHTGRGSREAPCALLFLPHCGLPRLVLDLPCCSPLPLLPAHLHTLGTNCHMWCRPKSPPVYLLYPPQLSLLACLQSFWILCQSLPTRDPTLTTQYRDPGPHKP